ncbi:STE/STE11 protein kinase [Anopheles sinensis]|uniref:STE/STE11 protein kinase n=1 Tax=Anopheles sinensis TaxID=74873 RepID=A0A084VFF3_ANOSI|nr:STE/STE11 protein kinase [Anopheles sinensis]
MDVDSTAATCGLRACLFETESRRQLDPTTKAHRARPDCQRLSIRRVPEGTRCQPPRCARYEQPTGNASCHRVRHGPNIFFTPNRIDVSTVMCALHLGR